MFCKFFNSQLNFTKFSLLIFFFNFTFLVNISSQEKSIDKPSKTKADTKTLELLKQLNSDDSDVLYKSDASNKLDSYMAEIARKTSDEKIGSSINTIAQDLKRIYSLIDMRVFKSKQGKVDGIKKINDLLENSSLSNGVFVAVKNGDYLLRCGSFKLNTPISINIGINNYSISEIAVDENFGIALYEWAIKPLENVKISIIDTCGAIGSIVFKIDQKGCISPCIISSISNFEYQEKKYKSFQVKGLENINEGDFFFNENGHLIGAGFSLKGNSLILDGLFLSNLVNGLNKSLGEKSSLGVLGSLSEKGFKIKEIVNPENKLKVNDIIEQIENIKITKENIYSVKQSFKKKKLFDLKIYREDKSIELKGVPSYQFILPNLQSRANDEYKKFYFWLDPIDKKQLSETIKFIANCKKMGIENYEIKYFRLNGESLLIWLSTVKLMQFLIINKKADVFEWFDKNPFQETAEYLIKFNLNFGLEKGTGEEILENKTDEEKVIENYTDGMLKHQISALPAISFAEGKAVNYSGDLEDGIKSLFEENGL